MAKPPPSGNLAEEHVEISDRILESAYKITVRHRDLIEIRQHGQIYMVIAETYTHFASLAAAFAVELI